ncbi:unnamed protein product [Vitrella brassicaformis CCMP3155]|uniref:Uncharacterized protein n=2 Tax=Vitrella brassicaformis TaxID=1169539 RepID=A0A0G4F3A4_VITBC|nr:unnamed protein product [Vitrella brassicaformis CCMP3155]|mmetsp:Transcript_14355/g.34279  ORF Transcript_14355/g.34279 Transcript_14355/m.34279 type:complete len:239 (+) Transcript_14355:61-777(+)|eukprot:CEM06406.1 unnamed protein product [Vitrella brassicaformis CCMP3155]
MWLCVTVALLSLTLSAAFIVPLRTPPNPSTRLHAAKTTGMPPKDQLLKELLAEKDRRLAAKEDMLEKLLAGKDMLIQEKDKRIADKDKLLLDYEKRLMMAEGLLNPRTVFEKLLIKALHDARLIRQPTMLAPETVAGKLAYVCKELQLNGGPRQDDRDTVQRFWNAFSKCSTTPGTDIHTFYTNMYTVLKEPIHGYPVFGLEVAVHPSLPEEYRCVIKEFADHWGLKIRVLDPAEVAT